MAEELEFLKRVVATLSFTLNPLAVVRAIRTLASAELFDPNISLEDFALSIDAARDAVAKVIYALMRHGVLVRAYPYLYSVANRESTLKALERLEEFFSDKIVIPDRVTLYFLEKEPRPLHLEYGTISVYFFAEKSNRIFKPKRIAVETVELDGVKYYVVNRDTLKNYVDRVLAVELKTVSEERHTFKGTARRDIHIYVGYKWVDPRSIGAQKLYFGECGITGDGVSWANVEDLLKHEFDLDLDDFIYIDDLDSVHWCRLDVEPLIGKLFTTAHLSRRRRVSKHFKISLLLQEIGERLGFESFTEYPAGPGRRYDVAYFKGGDLVAVFEIVATGSYKYALHKLREADAVVKVLVASRSLLSVISRLLPPDIKVIELELAEEALRSSTALISLANKIREVLSFE